MDIYNYFVTEESPQEIVLIPEKVCHFPASCSRESPTPNALRSSKTVGLDLRRIIQPDPGWVILKTGF